MLSSARPNCLLTSNKLSDISGKAIPQSTADDANGSDIDGNLSAKSTAEVITDEGEDDGWKEERSGDETE